MSDALWEGDAGSLPDRARRALVQLIRGPYLSRGRHRELWEAVLANEGVLRSRLHDLFLELLVDRDNEFAFVRKVDAEGVPEVVRTHRLTFMDSAMLLLLRQILLREDGSAIVGKDELTDALSVYRSQGRDESDFRRRVNASWNTIADLGLLKKVGDERAEISPIVRYVIDPEQVATLQKTYERIAEGT